MAGKVDRMCIKCGISLPPKEGKERVYYEGNFIRFGVYCNECFSQPEAHVIRVTDVRQA